MKLSANHLTAVAKRSGLSPVAPAKAQEPQVVRPVAPPPPDSSRLAEAIENLRLMQPAPQIVEVPAQIDTQALGEAIAQAMRQANPNSKPTGWRFTVKRDVDGLIESIDARPQK